MSTRCTIRDARDEASGRGFHLYEDLAENGNCVMLELEGFTFETSVSFASSGDFETRVLLRIPKRWARKLGLIGEEAQTPPDSRKAGADSREIMAGQERELRRAAVGELRQAHDIAVLSGISDEEMLRQLEQWKAEGRIFSVEEEGAEYFPLYALDPQAGYRPYPAMAEVLRIMVQGETWRNRSSLACWFIGANSFLDDLRPQDMFASDPEWLIEAAADAIETERDRRA